MKQGLNKIFAGRDASVDTTPRSSISRTLRPHSPLSEASLDPDSRGGLGRQGRAGVGGNGTKKAAKKTTALGGVNKPSHLSDFGAKTVGRVKVGIRCRPPFQDEIDFARGQFIPIIDTFAESPSLGQLGQVALTMMSGKQRNFVFDYAIGPRDSQDSVYDRIARPVVNDVLAGYNGTIFAYGQTGTGKTYTMGILEAVSDEHAGIIPRAISQLFEHIDSHPNVSVTITLSFLQLYRYKNV